MPDRLLNKYEEATYERVWKVAEKNWAHVDFKIRLKDVLKAMNESLLSRLEASTNASAQAAFSYALKAHLDFVVTDALWHPLFAVEFDGPTHQTDPQQQRCDRRKDALMKRFGLPLLRIDARYLNRKFRGFDLLSYFLELWFWRDSYLKASNPIDDDVFDEYGLEDPDNAIWLEEQDPSSPYYLSRAIDERIRDLFETGHLASSHLNYFIGQDDAAAYRCIMWILLAGGGCCFVETSMKPKQFPVPTSFLVAQITAFHLFAQLQSVLGGERAAHPRVKLKKKFDRYTSHLAYRKQCGGL